MLTSLLDFIYLGEVNVYQDNLEKFLQMAEEFKIKGLAGSYAPERSAQNRCPIENVVKEMKFEPSINTLSTLESFHNYDRPFDNQTKKQYNDKTYQDETNNLLAVTCMKLIL